MAGVKSILTTLKRYFSIIYSSRMYMGLPKWLSSKESACQSRGHQRRRFNPWVRKIPGGGNGNLLAPLFLPGKSHRQRSLECYSLWVTEHKLIYIPWLSNFTLKYIPNPQSAYTESPKHMCKNVHGILYVFIILNYYLKVPELEAILVFTTVRGVRAYWCVHITIHHTAAQWMNEWHTWPFYLVGSPKENLECRKPCVKLCILIQLYSCMYSLYNCSISKTYLCWDNGRMSTSRKDGVDGWKEALWELLSAACYLTLVLVYMYVCSFCNNSRHCVLHISMYMYMCVSMCMHV